MLLITIVKVIRMGYNVIAPIGDNPNAIFAGIKEFPTEKVYLITAAHNREKAEKLAEKLKDFTIATQIMEIKGNTLEEMFKSFAKVSMNHDPDDIIVNLATGDPMSTCAALSAAFANGLKAFGVENDRTMLMPIMKLSYYNELSENKMKILKELHPTDHISLQALAKKLSMSISLLSYHIHGNYKYKGLKEFRLVDLKDSKKSVMVRLSEMGNLLLKGYIQKPEKGG